MSGAYRAGGWETLTHTHLDSYCGMWLLNLGISLRIFNGEARVVLVLLQSPSLCFKQSLFFDLALADGFIALLDSLVADVVLLSSQAHEGFGRFAFVQIIGQSLSHRYLSGHFRHCDPTGTNW